MQINLADLHATNLRWRGWMESNTPFKPVETIDALRYALCEACEAMDVFLRHKNQDHARNNARNHDLHQELADCAMMLLTALSDEDAPILDFDVRHWRLESFFDEEWQGIDGVCHAVSCALDEYRLNEGGWIYYLHCALHHINTYPGMDLPSELDKCWLRLALKHGEIELTGWWTQQDGYETTLRYLYQMHRVIPPVPWASPEAQEVT